MIVAVLVSIALAGATFVALTALGLPGAIAGVCALLAFVLVLVGGRERRLP